MVNLLSSTAMRGHQNRDKEQVPVSDGDGGGSSSGHNNIVVSKTGARIKLNGHIEDTWSHGERYKSNGWSCAYCPEKKSSGGKTRFTQHLAGIQGDVVPCQKVPNHVRQIMLDVHAKGMKDRLSTREHKLYVEKAIMEEIYEGARRATIPRDEAGQVDWAIRESMRDYRKSGSSPPLGMASGSSPPLGTSTPPLGRASFSGTQTKMNRFYRSPSISEGPFDIDLARSRAPLQPRVDIMLQGGDNRARLGKAWAKWFHCNDIPGRKADNPYFIAAVKLTQQLGEVPLPTGRQIDGPLLDMNFDELKADMENYKENWGQYGVTIMCDSWTGPTKMCIINFMIFCNGRMFFHKTINATGLVQNAEFIYDCIRKVVVDEVGKEFVVQIVTDNGSNYKKACKKLTDEYKHITWQPCAAHTINLMLKDITQYIEVEQVVVSAKRICNYLYNHGRLHAMMRETGVLIVSQCTSSSGCERNWSTFALVHSKLRNRLGYEKLDKLVYVHYNLKLSIQQHETDFQSLRQMDADPCSMMMDVALFDEDNPIMDWLSNSMTESRPILDEYDDSDDEWTAPGAFLISELEMQPEEVLAFKRKLNFGKKGGKKKVKVGGLDEEEEECFEDDYESDSSHGSPVYAESGDSSSASDEDGDDVGENGSGGSNTCGEAATRLGDEASGSSRACGGERWRSGVRIGRPSCSIRSKSTRKRKPTLKSIAEL